MRRSTGAAIALVVGAVEILDLRIALIEVKVKVAAAIGTDQQYLTQIDDRLSIEEDIKNTYLNPASSIFEEPNNLLKQEVREPAIYNAMITAIASGCSRMKEISNKVGETPASARPTLKI